MTMADPLALLFEQELVRRGIAFRLDDASERYVIRHAGLDLFVGLDNLRRGYARDGDASRVARFLDSVLATPVGGPESWAEAQANVLFCLEPSGYAEPPPLRVTLSDLVDRVLVHWDASRNTISWISQDQLDDWQVSLTDLSAVASGNLARALAEADVQYTEIDGMRLGWLSSALPFKTALMLAPNLKQVLSPVLGWPLLAVAPDRDFLYLWDAGHDDLLRRVGGVVVKEFKTAAYPLSTEVFRIDDEGISAIGAFPMDADVPS
jgi:hypothetical protein